MSFSFEEIEIGTVGNPTWTLTWYRHNHQKTLPFQYISPAFLTDPYFFINGKPCQVLISWRYPIIKLTLLQIQQWFPLFKFSLSPSQGFPGGSEGKASVCNAGDLGSIPERGRSPGEVNGNHSSIFAWRIPWMEEPGSLESTGSQRVRHDWETSLSFFKTLPTSIY